MGANARRETLRGLSFLVALLPVLLGTSRALAFPPYQDTDADTTPPWAIELTLGLVEFTRDGGESRSATPLAAVNLGLPHHLELNGELEYVPAEGELGDAAAGAKWIPFYDELSIGLEVLALLPVSSEGGAGVEFAALATQRWETLRMHVNAGGFYDARPTPSEEGWKSGVLGELELDRFRPGLELFAEQVFSEPVAVQAGAGVIVSLGEIDLRAGMHAGLTRGAPDLTASLWIAGTFPFADEGDEGDEAATPAEARRSSATR